MLVEIWHQAPKGSSPPLIGGWQSTRADSGVVTGRRLVPGTKDVLLGRAKVPLVQLLQKSTGLYANIIHEMLTCTHKELLLYANPVFHCFAGICGWFALESHVSAISSDSPNRSESVASIVGGVEISASFMNEEIRDLVVSSGLRHGWRPPPSSATGFFPLATGRVATPQMLQLPLCSTCRSGSSGSTQRRLMKGEKPCFDGKGIRCEIGISHASLRLSAVDIPTASRPTHKYCFLRYRFFDQGELNQCQCSPTKQKNGRA
jgi:hypothetical protein